MILFRKPQRGEEVQILSLVQTVLAEYELKINSEVTDSDLIDLDQSYFNRNGWFSVIEDDGNIVGTYGIYRIDDQTCELRKMYLQKSYQGKGLGKQMMEEVFLKARELNYKSINLETNSRLTKAVELYRKYGFVEIIPAHLSDRCDLAMMRSL